MFDGRYFQPLDRLAWAAHLRRKQAFLAGPAALPYRLDPDEAEAIMSGAAEPMPALRRRIERDMAADAEPPREPLSPEQLQLCGVLLLGSAA